MRRSYDQSPQKISSKIASRQSYRLLYRERQQSHKPGKNSQAGQIVVEYVLVLVVAVLMAFAIVRGFINREDGNEGVIIQAWMRMLGAIGTDKADDIQRAD